MKATFVGRDSIGFEKGKQYYIRSKLQLVSIPYGNVYKPKICICIYNENGTNWYPYESLEAVLSNWKFG